MSYLSASRWLRGALWSLGLALGAVTATPTLAQDASQDAHKAAMQRLAPLEGSFAVTGVRHSQEGETPLPQSIAKSAYILNGFGLEETVEVDMGMEKPVTLLTTFSYDPYRKVYRVSVLDDTFGLLDVYEGRFNSEGVLSVTNLRSDSYFPMGEDGDRLHFMLQWTLNDPVKKFDILMTPDGGASWSPYFELEYTPVQ